MEALKRCGRDLTREKLVAELEKIQNFHSSMGTVSFKPFDPKDPLSRIGQQEIFLLYYMAGAALASPFQGLLWNQYLVQSDAAKMLGVAEFIPSWVAPAADSESMIERSFLHRDWLIPILLLVGSQIIQRIDRFGLGYALYRITSDVERLPFPMAPVGALGTMALAESADEKEKGWKWRVFSIGGVIGLAFGAIYVLLPVVSGLIFTEPIRLIPIPWIELTRHTEEALPAVATGLQLDLGLQNVKIQTFDGTVGWGEAAPFDRILVTAGAPSAPKPLLEQLTVGGVLVVPEGDLERQRLVRYRRLRGGGHRRQEGEAVAFVPLVGRFGWQDGE